MARTKTRSGGGTIGSEGWRPVDRQPTEPCQAKGGHRVGPHNRCNHGTPPPAGYVPCAGDPGCPYRIPQRHARKGQTHCPWHTELAAPYSIADGMDQLMGAAR